MGMNFGLCLTGWAAAHLGNKRLTGEITDDLAKFYWTTGMGSFHDPGLIFNVDACGGYPYLVAQCPAYSEPGYLKLLPALPDRWEKGTIEGLLLRGNVTLQKLEWDEKTVKITLSVPYSGNINVELGNQVKTLELIKDKSVSYVFNK
jgi:hypothetical protein